MKKHILWAIFLAPTSIFAQNIYTAEQYASEDLVGTARYVGMGGAMNVLGADLSTMGVNPAATGLFRQSDASFTLGFIHLSDAKKFNGYGANRVSADQGGFVYSNALDGNNLKFINFGFNFQKRKNFKQYLGAFNHSLNGTSQSYTMANLGRLYYGDYTELKDNQYHFDIPFLDVAYNSMMVDPTITDDGKNVEMTDWNGTPAENYTYQREQHGGVQQYDFNVGLNFNDKLYTGFSLGVYSVRQNSSVGYHENLIEPGSSQLHPYDMWQSESTDGSGVDFKLGAIVRPIDDNPLRFGIAVSSPTWFELSTQKILKMRSPFVPTGSQETTTTAGFDTGTYDWNIRTPWKLNIGAATTIAQCVAIDVEYQYENIASSTIKYPSGDKYIDGYGNSFWEHQNTDRAMKQQINKYLKGVHTLRLGMEGVLSPHWLVRFGMNHVTAPMEKNAFRNLYASVNTSHPDSPSLYNLTGTDYVNLGALTRITTGVGYRYKHFYADVAYLWQTQKADIYPFHDTKVFESDAAIAANGLTPYSTDLKQHRLILTMGVRF